MLIITDYSSHFRAFFAEDAIIGVQFRSLVVDVGVFFEAVGATSLVLITALFPVVVLLAVRAFLMALTGSRSVAEAEALKASGNYDKVFDFAHVPMNFNFPERNQFPP
jgi:hypothetical protein